MPKVLLINPPFNIPKENYDSSISVGLLCLGSYLKDKGMDVQIIDGARQKNYEELIDRALPETDCAGISVMTTQVAPALEITKRIKDYNPAIRMIWGGLHPTFFPNQVVKHPLIDVAVHNEGEETLIELINHFRSGGTPEGLRNILGIAYKEGGEARINAKRPFLKMDDLPLPIWEVMPEEVLRGLRLVPTHTSRGCPHRCAFCVNAITQNLWRSRSAESVLKDLEIIKSKPYFSGKPVRFWDENFFVNKQRAVEIVQGMIDRNLDITWETTVRVDYFKDAMVNDDFLGKLKKSGCYLLSFGAESGSEKILKKIDKDITKDEVLNSARQCTKFQITPQYSFMVGLPGETNADSMETVDLIGRLIKVGPGVQILGPQAFRPYPGSKLYEECLESGWKEPQSLEEWARLMKEQLSYLTPRNFPWLKDPDFVESLEAYVRFGAHSIKSALGSSIKSNLLLKLPFILVCKLRWKLKFFKFPWDFKLAKRFVTKTASSS